WTKASHRASAKQSSGRLDTKNDVVVTNLSSLCLNLFSIIFSLLLRMTSHPSSIQQQQQQQPYPGEMLQYPDSPMNLFNNAHIANIHHSRKDPKMLPDALSQDSKNDQFVTRFNTQSNMKMFTRDFNTRPNIMDYRKAPGN
ncbi:hypothetical protein M8C21_032179, partial [Ambrosia artemisiifolia]